MNSIADHWASLGKAKAAVNAFLASLNQPPIDQNMEQKQFRESFLPNFRTVCKHEGPALALEIEQILYTSYVKRWEEESHFRSVYQYITDILRDVTHSASNDLAKIRKTKKSRNKSTEDAVPLVFFIVHVESELAHVQSLLRYLEALTEFRNEIEQICPVVVSLDGCHPGFRKRLTRLNVQLISLGDRQPKHHNGYVKLLKLAVLCNETQPQAIVFVSLVLWMTTFFAARLANTQIWWAMKYHAFSTPDIDGFLCGSPDGKPRLLGGNHWETAPFGGSEWFAPELRHEATAIRTRLGQWKTVFGSIGREEKLRDPDFLDTVCSVLEANPNSVFLWTGKHQDKSIQRFFEARRLTERTRFIGWVNTRLYAQVIDIYLDSFPFPGGYTVYEAMAAQKPVIMMQLDYQSVGLQNNVSPYYFSESTEGINGEIQKMFRKNDDNIYFPVARNKKEYIHFSRRIASDPFLCKAIGSINSDFVEKFMSNRKGMAAGYTNAIRKFILQRKFRPIK